MSEPRDLPGARHGESAHGAFRSGDQVAVLLPLPLAGAYDYLVADGMTVAPGDFVEVPLGGRALPGVVWGAGSRPARPRPS